ncbi:EF-hand calcium-binding domain-containing protein 1 [Cephus cinctus]|uniref:EF-hand calcium-binding domain-containing protein 1 n=1 Tax=Cephus cinctus TaxID=211228 RepID=A0AAJ7FEG6_CEPCN|nr:EF-hand calcium-binding domain-containing protein 1 [Cephus cinctus]XP_015587746.1 EF-hand calcium-binding domain-containing protein 1 [Cephus cinctus]XP_015587747.1 EF-hand calcium-binding domain-containing protein 1 [Cephus cinctus]
MAGRISSSPSTAVYQGGDEIGVGAVGRTPISGRGGAMVMRSVSIFLTNGRKVSIVSKRQQNISAGTVSGGRRRKKMPDDGSIKSAAFNTKIIETLRKKTKFSRGELEALWKIYRKLITTPGQQVGPVTTINGMPSPVQTIEGIDRTIFRELLHNTFDIITEDTLVERMFCCWDKDNESAIRLEPWIMGLDVFLRGSLRERMEFCFRVYDLNGDGYITKDEMFQLLKNCLIKQPGEEDPDEGVRDLSELALKKLDVDHDGKVSFEDYELAIKEEPLLLEAFGQCLPTEESSTAFLTTLQP